MTRKDYIVFAWILVKNTIMYRNMDLGDDTNYLWAQGFHSGAAHALMKIQADLEIQFASNNKNFDRERFRNYIAEGTR